MVERSGIVIAGRLTRAAKACLTPTRKANALAGSPSRQSKHDNPAPSPVLSELGQAQRGIRTVTPIRMAQCLAVLVVLAELEAHGAALMSAVIVGFGYSERAKR